MVVQFAAILRTDDVAAHLVDASAGQLQSGRIRFRSLRQRSRFFDGRFGRCRGGTRRSNLDGSATAAVATTATVTGGLAATLAAAEQVVQQVEQRSTARFLRTEVARTTCIASTTGIARTTGCFFAAGGLFAAGDFFAATAVALLAFEQSFQTAEQIALLFAARIASATGCFFAAGRLFAASNFFAASDFFFATGRLFAAGALALLAVEQSLEAAEQITLFLAARIARTTGCFFAAGGFFTTGRCFAAGRLFATGRRFAAGRLFAAGNLAASTAPAAATAVEPQQAAKEVLREPLAA